MEFYIFKLHRQFISRFQKGVGSLASGKGFNLCEASGTRPFLADECLQLLSLLAKAGGEKISHWRSHGCTTIGVSDRPSS